MSSNKPSSGSGTWQVVGLHHIAFAHEPDGDVEGALAKLFGLVSCHDEPGAGFVERMVPVSDECYLQLLEATGDGVVSRFVSRRGPALHHVAFEVTDVDAAVRDLAAAGVKLVDSEPRAGGLQTRIAFVHPESVGGLLVELVEKGRLPEVNEI